MTCLYTTCYVITMTTFISNCGQSIKARLHFIFKLLVQCILDLRGRGVYKSKTWSPIQASGSTHIDLGGRGVYTIDTLSSIEASGSMLLHLRGRGVCKNETSPSIKASGLMLLDLRGRGVCNTKTSPSIKASGSTVLDLRESYVTFMHFLIFSIVFLFSQSHNISNSKY